MVNSVKSIRQFLLKNCTFEEKMEYVSWMNGEKNKDSWITNALEQREQIILRHPNCDQCIETNCPINVYETGHCKCLNNHNCENIILDIVNSV